VLPQVSLEIKQDLTLKIHLILILDKSEKELQNKRILMVKILWKSSQIKEIMWEQKSEIKKIYLELFLDTCMN
jgi:hypothetical protein